MFGSRTTVKKVRNSLTWFSQALHTTCYKLGLERLTGAPFLKKYGSKQRFYENEYQGYDYQEVRAQWNAQKHGFTQLQQPGPVVVFPAETAVLDPLFQQICRKEELLSLQYRNRNHRFEPENQEKETGCRDIWVATVAELCYIFCDLMFAHHHDCVSRGALQLGAFVKKRAPPRQQCQFIGDLPMRQSLASDNWLLYLWSLRWWKHGSGFSSPPRLVSPRSWYFHLDYADANSWEWIH